MTCKLGILLKAIINSCCSRCKYFNLYNKKNKENTYNPTIECSNKHVDHNNALEDFLRKECTEYEVRK